MPSRVYVHLKDVSKPNIVQNGDTVDIDKEKGELSVKDATGELLGWFRYPLVVGWWLEREPVDPQNLSGKDLARVIAEIEKHGMKPEEEPPTLT